jgi:hypothetical protein
MKCWATPSNKAGRVKRQTRCSVLEHTHGKRKTAQNREKSGNQGSTTWNLRRGTLQKRIPEHDTTAAVPPDGELSSWKQIASYLGVSIRTAQTLERERGLPVRRLAGPGGRVTASVAVLDTWRRASDQPSITLERSTPESPQAKPWYRTHAWLAVAGIALVVVLLLAARTHPGTARPSSWRIERTTLIILDDYGRELWRKAFPYTLVEASVPDSAARDTWIGDLDGDGHPEVLFAPHPTIAPRESTPLICYNERGVEAWRYVNHQRVRTSTEEFSPVFGIARFLVTSLGHGRKAVLIATTHRFYYPCQVVLVSPQGRVLREYWHSGHLNVLDTAEHDGTTTFYLAGISNAWHAATIVALDPDHFGGASQEPEAPDHQLLGFAPARERTRVILPRSCVNTATSPYNTIIDMSVADGVMTVQTGELLGPSRAGIFHHLSLDFRQHRVVLSDSYQVEYQRAVAGRTLKGCTLDDTNLQTLNIIKQN